MSDDRPPESKTDWIATCTEAWGVGFTKQGALQTMAGYLDTPGGVSEVLLVEHVGEVSVRGLWVDCHDTFVQEEKIKLDSDDKATLRSLSEHTDVAQRHAEKLYDTVEITDSYDAFE